MSASTRRLPLAEAEAIARTIASALSPGCDRIEVAGSIRRRKPDVGDIEIVAIPARVLDLFGDPGESRLEPILERLHREGSLSPVKGGRYYRQYMVTEAGCKLDLFTPDRETWGVVFTQRTGSAEYAHQLMTDHRTRTSTGRPGLMPAGFRVFRARLWHHMEMVPTPEEGDFFRALGLPWVRPEDRR